MTPDRDRWVALGRLAHLRLFDDPLPWLHPQPPLNRPITAGEAPVRTNRPRRHHPPRLHPRRHLHRHLLRCRLRFHRTPATCRRSRRDRDHGVRPMPVRTPLGCRGPAGPPILCRGTGRRRGREADLNRCSRRDGGSGRRGSAGSTPRRRPRSRPRESPRAGARRWRARGTRPTWRR